jgi:hypothetical protein
MLVAVALLLTHVPHDLEQRGGHYLAWVLLCALSDSMWLRALSGEGSSSMGSAAGLATAILWGMSPSMWIVGSSTWLAELIVQRKGWLRASFNASQVTITMWATCGVFALLGGPIGGLAGVALAPGVRLALQLAVPILAMFATYLLVNRALVACAVAWSTERPYLRCCATTGSTRTNCSPTSRRSC